MKKHKTTTVRINDIFPSSISIQFSSLIYFKDIDGPVEIASISATARK